MFGWVKMDGELMAKNISSMAKIECNEIVKRDGKLTYCVNKGKENNPMHIYVCVCGWMWFIIPWMAMVMIVYCSVYVCSNVYK